MINRYAVLCVTAVSLLVSSVSTMADQFVPHSIWRFENSLVDEGTNKCAAFSDKQEYVTTADDSVALRPLKPVVVHDSPWLRLTPGIRLNCRLKFDKLKTGSGWTTVAMKGDYSSGEYVLRVNPSAEGGKLGFFVNTGEWEPRIESQDAVKAGLWYDISAGWDGTNIWLEVNGERTARRRIGQPRISYDPLVIGTFDGALDQFEIINPKVERSYVAYWPFEGDLRDLSGNGHDGEYARKRLYVEGHRGGRAMQGYPGLIKVAHAPELMLAPGLRLECSLFFEEMPKNFVTVLRKEGEYMLRVEKGEQGAKLTFFVFADSRWSPHLECAAELELNQWHDVIARWDGLCMTLDVNGKRSDLLRSGKISTKSAPLEIGSFKGSIDNLAIENARLPAITMRDLNGSSVLPYTGQSERFTARIHNFGSNATGCYIILKLPEGVESESPLRLELGDMTTESDREVSWTLRALRSLTADLEFQIFCDQGRQATLTHRLAVFPKEIGENDNTVFNHPVYTDEQAKCYFVDALEGDNSNDGRSAAKAWRDFTLVNNTTLGPGETLLIRRGSVINQELTLNAKGASNNWVRIAAYGEGPRPMIRRNKDIRERCALFVDPDYLHISNLVVCDAAKGLIVYYKTAGHRGLLIEDCIAHHIEGLYRSDAHGIPGWSYRDAPYGDQLHGSAGIGISGNQGQDVVIRDCEMFQCSWGFYVTGDNVMIDRVFCHDNFTLNTSPHPAMVNVSRARLLRSIFDASGYHASAGTMGIMLVNITTLLINNCHFMNQPDSGCHDQGGIDFEAHGYGCLVDRCTFRNNAGAAIEMLGLSKPQARNLEIAKSRFFRNNVADKLGPSEIFIWGKSSNPEVCCSTGLIRDNGYTLLPGVSFFTNQAPALAQWMLADNREYASPAALEQAMPLNNPPQPDAGVELWSDQKSLRLEGRVADDQRTQQPLQVRWEVISAPGQVTFTDSAALITEAQFAVAGDYHLRLVADDGELWRSSHTVVHILPPGSAVTRAWDFAVPLDKAGWSEENLGTQFKELKHTHSHPVREPAGGLYLLALESADTAALVSPVELNIDTATNQRIVIRCQNNTGSRKMRLSFITDLNPQWDRRQALEFTVASHDPRQRVYTLDMGSVEGWQGALQQFKVEFSADNSPITGICRIDYIWVGNQR